MLKQLSCKVGWVLLLLSYSVLAQAALPEFVSLVEQYSPAVVNISTRQKVAASDLAELPLPELPEGSELRDFLKKFLERHGQGAVPGVPDDHGGIDSSSLGSGFVISSDGYILTNRHVVKDADEIIVRFSDRKEYSASVIGTDGRTDVALIKVEAEGLPVLKMGDSEQLKVGEWVLAIGSPFGFDHSATAGIVSAKGRSLPSEQYVPFIQTDVAINPGNSGGPLFNLQGEVVGINSQIYSRTGGFMGLSFAIPIEVAMDVAQQLKTTGKVTRGWLGVYIQEVTRELAESFGMPTPRGALVAQVIAESPAQKSGIEVGDIIIEFNGEPITHSADLPPLVGLTPVGKTATVKLLREGKQLSLEVRIEALPDEAEAETGRAPGSRNAVPRLGIKVKPLDAETRKALQIKEGVVVSEVTAGPAAEAGISTGDILVSINNRPVKDLKTLREIVAELPKGQSVAVLVQREDGPVFLPLKIED